MLIIDSSSENDLVVDDGMQEQPVHRIAAANLICNIQQEPRRSAIRNRINVNIAHTFLDSTRAVSLLLLSI